MSVIGKRQVTGWIGRESLRPKSLALNMEGFGDVISVGSGQWATAGDFCYLANSHPETGCLMVVVLASEDHLGPTPG